MPFFESDFLIDLVDLFGIELVLAVFFSFLRVVLPLELDRFFFDLSSRSDFHFLSYFHSDEGAMPFQTMASISLLIVSTGEVVQTIILSESLRSSSRGEPTSTTAGCSW